MGEAGHHPLGRHLRHPLHQLPHHGQQGVVRFVQVGVVGALHVAEESAKLGWLLQIQQPLTGSKAQVGLGQAHHHRTAGGGGFVPAIELLARFNEAHGAAGGHTQAMEGLRGNHLPHPSLEGQTPVPATGPGGLARSLGAQILEPAMAIPHLAVEKSAPVPKLGIVDAKLIAVVAQCQQGLTSQKATVGGLQMVPVHGGRVQAQLPQQIVVPKPQTGFREAGGLHHVPIVTPQVLQGRLKGEPQQGIGPVDGH